jgi:hypothetical protein
MNAAGLLDGLIELPGMLGVYAVGRYGDRVPAGPYDRARDRASPSGAPALTTAPDAIMAWVMSNA